MDCCGFRLGPVSGRIPGLAARLVGISLAGLEDFVPVLCVLRRDALDARVASGEAFGGFVPRGVVVVSACEGLQVEGLDPERQARGDAGGGEEQVEAVDFGEFESGESVDGAFDDEGGLRRAIQNPPRALRDPGAMPRKGFSGWIPSSSAPAGCFSALRTMKTAFERRSAPRMRCRKPATRIAGSRQRLRQRYSCTRGQKVGSRRSRNDGRAGASRGGAMWARVLRASRKEPFWACRTRSMAPPPPCPLRWS